MMQTKMSKEELARVRVHYEWHDPETGIDDVDCAMADIQIARPVYRASLVEAVNCPECLRRRLWERGA